MLRRALLGPMLASALLSGCGGGDHRSRPSPRSAFFGVNAQFVLDGPESSWAEHLDRMAAAGLGSVRFDALWDRAEPVPPVAGRHTYVWAPFDAIAGALARRRLRWLPIVGYSAPWAGSVPGARFSAPRDDAEFAAYAAAFAARYGPRGAFWREHPGLPAVPVTEVEIWNEPDNEVFWKPRPDAGRYAALLDEATAAVKRSAPAVEVMAGGVTPGGLGFLAAVLASRPRLRTMLSAVAIHPYAPSVRGVIEHVAAMRQMLRRAGAGGLPIEVTELGWPVRGSSGFVVSERERAELLRGVAKGLRASGCGVRALYPYAWLTLERSPDDAEEWYGLYDTAARPSPGGAAYEQGVRDAERRARSAKPARRDACD